MHWHFAVAEGMAGLGGACRRGRTGGDDDLGLDRTSSDEGIKDSELGGTSGDEKKR